MFFCISICDWNNLQFFFFRRLFACVDGVNVENASLEFRLKLLILLESAGGGLFVDCCCC